MTDESVVQLSINTIRALSMDAVQQAKSGHPGTPMALAPLVYTIWNRVMRFDPQDPIWPNRDRFVLSNRHASMLLWSVLHLTGVQAVNADYERLGQPSVTLDDIRRFRQLDSKAPGHPEYHWVSGVETTTGPLGQGVASGVGMAIGQKWLANRYNRPGFDIFDYAIYIFSDYARPAIRLSALMELPTIFVFTHDAMGDGEDGPTHQPVEQLLSLRAIPGLTTLRPGDANEVVEAYRYIVQLRHQSAVLALSRQPLPTLDRSKYAPASGVARGAYVLADAPGGNPEVILIATGSELSLAVEAHEKLLAEGIRSRVVSMPSWDIFDHQTQEYRDTVLPPTVKARVAVEQASTLGWERYVGPSGRVIGMKTFGASAPLKELQRKFGFEPDRVAAAAKELLGRG
jgi:transketolase